MQKEINFSLEPRDEAVVRAAIEWLDGERGAVSANVQLPSGRSVLVHRDGQVWEAA